MYFALGALSVGLVSLLLLPAISRRAFRLSRRRLEMLLPLSMNEVVAERDLLRAEFAAERRRLEQRMEAQSGVHAQELAELGRRAAEIVGLKDELARLGADHAALGAAHATALRDLAEANGERGALINELHDATGLNETLRARHDALTARHAEVSEIAEQRRGALTALETRAEGLDATVARLESELQAALRRVKNEEDRALGLGEERDMVLREMRSLEQLMAATQARFESERQRASQLQTTMDERRREIDETALAQRESQKAIDAAERAREASEARATALSQKLDAHQETARAAERSAADQIESLRSEIAALKGALQAARSGRSSDALVAPAETASLRAAVAEIGAKVAQLADEGRLR